jgi:octaprenyl-diphosphate synthase
VAGWLGVLSAALARTGLALCRASAMSLKCRVDGWKMSLARAPCPPVRMVDARRWLGQVRPLPIIQCSIRIFVRPGGRSLSADRVTSTSAPIASYRTLSAPDMAEVDQVIHRRLASKVALVNQISHYIVSAGGKRVRPMLLLLIAQALGSKGTERHELAAVVEFIHTATLLHDDVVDESNLRRGRQTANAMFGNAASVLVGDFLYSRAFQMMVSTNRLRVMDVLAEATNVIAEGEVLQLMNMHDPDISVDDYLRVIEYKTAKLFEASARLGALITDAPPEVEEACAAYGRALGTAFQLIDDLLDYEGSTAELGKNIGDDLREGKPTLPLLVAMARGTPEQREMIRQAIINGEIERMAQIVEVVKATGALQATREAAQAQAEVAKSCLDKLPESEWRQALLELSFDSINRSS